MDKLKKIIIYFCLYKISFYLYSFVYYVSPSGSDSNAGTFDKPWKTLQKAFSNVKGGDTVFIREGIYNEKIVVNVSGNSEEGFITFLPYKNEKVIISGKKVTRKEQVFSDNIIYIENKDFIKIIGFYITDIETSEEGSGIRIYGSGSNIIVKNNKIFNIRGRNAMGITVYGRDGLGLSNIVIEENEIFECDPAPSEALVVNGNVRNFIISKNKVYNVNNIGIDIIGGEKWLSTERPKNGYCIGNIVYNVRERKEGFAAGIYVDGALDVIIERNMVFNCDLGIEVGAENKGTVAKNIIVRNNIIFNNYKGGIVFGGYSESVGGVENCIFINNTLYNNTKETKEFGEVWVQHAKNNKVINNIIFSFYNEKNHASLITFVNETMKNSNFIHNNLYYVFNGNINENYFIIGNKRINFIDFKKNIDLQGVFLNPEFVSAENNNFALKSISYCIDNGIITNEIGEFDFFNNRRLKGRSVDLGAIEF